MRGTVSGGGAAAKNFTIFAGGGKWGTIPKLQYLELVTTTLDESYAPTVQPATSLLPQILYDPLRQRFGRGGVLTSIQLTVNHDVGLEKPGAIKSSPEFIDLVLQKEADIL